MSKIAEALEKKNKNCIFSNIFKKLDVEDQDAVSGAISKGLSGHVIASALREGGYKVAASTVALHIAEKCKCV